MTSKDKKSASAWRKNQNKDIEIGSKTTRPQTDIPRVARARASRLHSPLVVSARGRRSEGVCGAAGLCRGCRGGCGRTPLWADPTLENFSKMFFEFFLKNAICLNFSKKDVPEILNDGKSDQFLVQKFFGIFFEKLGPPPRSSELSCYEIRCIRA